MGSWKILSLQPWYFFFSNVVNEFCWHLFPWHPCIFFILHLRFSTVLLTNTTLHAACFISHVPEHPLLDTETHWCGHWMLSVPSVLLNGSLIPLAHPPSLTSTPQQQADVVHGDDPAQIQFIQSRTVLHERVISSASASESPNIYSLTDVFLCVHACISWLYFHPILLFLVLFLTVSSTY